MLQKLREWIEASRRQSETNAIIGALNYYASKRAEIDANEPKLRARLAELLPPGAAMPEPDPYAHMAELDGVPAYKRRGIHIEGLA